MIGIKVFKASEGDSILVSFGENKEFNIMVDMGLDSTYRKYIKKELIKLRDKKKELDLLIVTHVDKDHILGALEFIKENKSTSEIIPVKEVWHNTYRHLNLKEDKDENISPRNRRVLNEIIESNKFKESKNGKSEISVKQGISLGGYLLKYKYNWNTLFGGRAVSTESNQSTIVLNENIKIILISPNKEKLDRLGKKWLKDLKCKYNINKIGYGDYWDDAFEFYMSHLKYGDDGENYISQGGSIEKNIEKLALKEEKDKSDTNGSTISFIIEYTKENKTKKLLFLGDAHEDIIYNKLVELKNKSYDLSFEAVKVSHHGSNKNISQRLVNLISSKRYIFSTDGKKHRHPHKEAIAKILNRNEKEFIQLIFNYDIASIKYLFDENLKSEYMYDIKILDENEYILL